MEAREETEYLLELKRRRRARRMPWVRFKKHLVYFPAVAVVLLLDSLSRPVSLALGRLIGFCFSLIPSRHLRRAVENLKIAFPEKSHTERLRIARKVFVNLGRVAAETAALRHNAGRFEGIVACDRSVEILENVLARGRGCIIVATHLNCWELLVAYMSHRFGAPAVKKKFKFDKFTQFTEAMREEAGTLVFDVDDFDEVKRAVDTNVPIVILPDLDMKKKTSITVKFFGKDAAVVRGPAVLALRNRTPIVCVFFHWNGRLNVLECAGPIEIPGGGLTDENQCIVTEAYMREIERAISKYPDQWPWFHDRWGKAE